MGNIHKDLAYAVPMQWAALAVASDSSPSDPFFDPFLTQAGRLSQNIKP